MPHTHKCYFHKESTITHFCTKKQCTLPMCQECLPIHLEEHDETCSADASEIVVSYGEAEQNAIFGLSSLIGIGKNLRAQCLTKVEQIKLGILEALDIYLESVKNRICSEFGELTELEKKLAKIQKGSLKTLIYFYSEESKEFDKSLFSQITHELSNIENSVKLSLKEPSKYPHQQNLPHTLHINYPEQTCPPQPKERIASMDVQGNQELVRKSNTKSSVNLLNVESNIRQQRSVTYHEEIKRGDSYKDTWQNEDKRDDRRSTDLRRMEVNDGGKQGEIERIRAKEEERKREKEMKEFALIEEQRNGRQKERERDRSIERSIQRHAEFEKHKAIPTNIENQRIHTFTDSTHQTSYKFPELNRNETRKYPTLLQDPSRAEYPLMEDTSRRRPLEIADLNVEGRTSLSRISGKGSASKGVVRSYTFNKENEARTSLCDNLFEMNNEVLSPEEIRNMLEKRIEERSRLISKNKISNNTPPKYAETSPHRGYSRNKELLGNEVVESERKWDTKDSIINQIYQDYRY